MQVISPDQSPPSPFKMGTIPDTYTSGLPTIKFDGETVASTKRYPCFGAYTPKAGDRVLLARVGHGWVVMDKVRMF